MTGGGLRLDDAAVAFGAGGGLRGLSLDVAAGERVALVGASGAGKTTLLRAIAGLAPLAAGRVLVGGRDVTRLAPEQRDAVYLHQVPVLFPHLSVGENVAFPLAVRGVPAAASRARVAAALVAMRLEGLDARMPHALSGGQRHRVALARAMAARPAVLLLDEPLSALDPVLRAEVREAIVAAHAGDSGDAPALLLVTHDLADAGALADRIAVLVDGGLAQVATPAELFLRPASLAVARFVGSFREVAGVLRADGAFESALGVVAGAGAARVADHQGAPRAHAPGPMVALVRRDALRASATGAIAARVVHVRHDAQGATALVALEAGGAHLDVAVDASAPPAPGSVLALDVDARRLVLLPA